MANNVTEKKLDYNFESKDFSIDGELTVTITLHEYRELVSAKATAQSDIRKAEEGKYEREDQNRRLKDENAKLKAELYELQKKMGMMQNVEEGGDE